LHKNEGRTAGSQKGAEPAAIMHSFFATCKAQQVNPWEWLNDILKSTSQQPANQIEELLPPKLKGS